MKKYFLTLGLMAVTALGTLSLRADDTNAVAAATAATTTPAPLPTGTVDQRLSAVEAYIANTDPLAGLKDTNGTQVATTAILGNPGPGHNAWLLTSTTYGSWLPGDPRGSVTSVRDVRPAEEPTIVRIEHDIPGEPYEDAIPELQDSARNRMKGPPLFLDREKAEVVLAQFQETAKFRRWTLRAAAIMYNHFHIVVEVPGDPQPGKVLGDFKAYGTRALNRKYGRPCRRRGGPRRVRNAS